LNPLSPPVVAVVRCDSYQREAVEQSFERAMALLGGASQFVREGEEILLKPNILFGEKPEKHISPHPEIFRATAKIFKQAGAHLSYGDSPGFGSLRLYVRVMGYAHIAEEMGIDLADFTHAVEMSNEGNHLVKKFAVARAVAHADGIINISKLKTHALTRITGAVKNQFGCIPGARKAEFHSVMPRVDLFSQMLVDLNLLLRSRLYVMDGIVGMEGNGPRNGIPRPVHALLFSTDPIALDATACRLMALDPDLVRTNVYGEKHGLGTYHQIRYVGDPLEDFIVPDFDVDRQEMPDAEDKTWLARSIMRRFTAPRPTIDAEKCTRCGQCTEICPVNPKALDWGKEGNAQPPQYNYSKCIRCYCCQETCPFEAISVKMPLAGRIIRFWN